MKTLFQTQLTDVEENDLEGIGTLRYEDNKVYRWVKYTASTALAAGDVVCHDITDEEDCHQEVSIPATADLSMLGGVVLATVADSSSTTHYFWIQVFGTGSAKVFHASDTGSMAAGAYVKPSNGVTYLTSDATTQPAYSRNVQILTAIGETTTTSGGYNVASFINCL
jgi:hypothetical protein